MMDPEIISDTSKLSSVENGGESRRSTSESEDPEERYLKIKNLTLKYKKLLTESASKAKEEKAKLLSANKNLQSLQEAYDSLEDSSDKFKKAQDVTEKALEELKKDSFVKDSIISDLKGKVNALEGKLAALEIDWKDLKADKGRSEEIIAKADKESKATDAKASILINENETLNNEITMLKEEDSEKTRIIEEISSKLKRTENDLDRLSKKATEDNETKDSEICSLKSQIDSFSETIRTMKLEATDKSDRIKELRARITDVETDFSSYRVRAQIVLKQARGSPSGTESNNSSSEHYDKTIESLNNKIKALSLLYSESQKEKDRLVEDRDKLLQRQSSLVQEIAVKDSSSRKKQEELLNLATKADDNCNALTIEHKLKIESLNKSHQLEVQRLASDHSSYTSSLNQKIESLENELLLKQINSTTPEIDSQSIKYLEREAGEGSEEKDSKIPIPLEELLELDDATPYRGEEISSLEKKAEYFSTLLSEAESENYRLVALVEALKEEIRNYRRSEQRIKHIEQLEYIKNVILKFLTLPRSEEKSHLLPVLSTILELSPEEVNRIEELVINKSDEEENTGWSSYLNWGGT